MRFKNLRKLFAKPVDPYRPTLHFAPARGWINDPNGFIRYGGRYHAFAQHNPHAPVWGPMHWLHLTSDDMITFRSHGVALVPEAPYEIEYGCFSGSAIERDGRMYLMYTGVSDGLQQQCLASSDDGMRFVKDVRNPVINAAQLPDEYDPADFRDPCVFEKEGMYYCLVAARRRAGGSSVLLYRSPDLESWTFVSSLLESSAIRADMFECPNFCTVDGRDVLLVSGQIVEDPKRCNRDKTMAFVGRLELPAGRFHVDFSQKLDWGFDSYATQTVSTPDGRRLLMYWMSAWNSDYPTQRDGWNGQFTLPREMSIADEHLRMVPARELDYYLGANLGGYRRLSQVRKSLGKSRGSFLDFTVTLDGGALGGKLAIGHGADRLELTLQSDHLTIDRSHTHNPIATPYGLEDQIRDLPLTPGDKHVVRVIVDASLIEIFVDGGAADACVRFYPSKVDYSVKIDGFSEGQITLDELRVLR